jgi:predicted ABC-type ATPase
VTSCPANRLLVVAGPNGAGKTTFALDYCQETGLRYLGADDLAARLRPGAPQEVAIEAGRSLSRELGAALEAGESLVVESTLSGKSFYRYLAQANRLGYRTQALFVTLDSPDLCIHRVQARVRRGGHDVPVEDIRRRFLRSHENFWKDYRLEVGSWHLYSSSWDEFRTVAYGGGRIGAVADESLFESFARTVEDRALSLEADARSEAYCDTIELQRIGSRAVQRALEENRRLGIPNSFSRNGKLHFELPDGEITQKDPFVDDPKK